MILPSDSYADCEVEEVIVLHESSNHSGELPIAQVPSNDFLVVPIIHDDEADQNARHAG